MRVNSDIGRVNIPDQGDHPEELTSHCPRWACSLGPERFDMQRSPRAEHSPLSNTHYEMAGGSKNKWLPLGTDARNLRSRRAFPRLQPSLASLFGTHVSINSVCWCPWGALADSLYSVHVKCLPGARMSLMISDDGTLHASAHHLLENCMRLAAAEPPPYRPLS